MIGMLFEGLERVLIVWAVVLGYGTLVILPIFLLVHWLLV